MEVVRIRARIRKPNLRYVKQGEPSGARMTEPEKGVELELHLGHAVQISSVASGSGCRDRPEIRKDKLQNMDRVTG